MKIQVKSSIESKVSVTDFTCLNSSLQSDLDRDHYLTQQYIEATQIITDLNELLVNIGDGSQDNLSNSSHSIFPSRPNNIRNFQPVPVAGTENNSSATTDLCIQISDLTKQLQAQLNDYSVNQRFITGSTDRLSAAIDIMSEGIDEIDQFLMPVKFDDRDE